MHSLPFGYKDHHSWLHTNLAVVDHPQVTPLTNDWPTVQVWCVPKLAEELKWGFDRLHNCATRVVHPVRKPGMLLVIDYYKHIVQICAELFAFSEALSSGCVQLVLARMWLQMTTRRPTGKAFLTRSMKSVLHSTVQLSVNVYSVQRWTARMHTNSFVFSHNFCIVWRVILVCIPLRNGRPWGHYSFFVLLLFVFFTIL